MHIDVRVSGVIAAHAPCPPVRVIGESAHCAFVAPLEDFDTAGQHEMKSAL